MTQALCGVRSHFGSRATVRNRGIGTLCSTCLLGMAPLPLRAVLAEIQASGLGSNLVKLLSYRAFEMVLRDPSDPNGMRNLKSYEQVGVPSTAGHVGTAPSPIEQVETLMAKQSVQIESSLQALASKVAAHINTNNAVVQALSDKLTLLVEAQALSARNSCESEVHAQLLSHIESSVRSLFSERLLKIEYSMQVLSSKVAALVGAF